MSKWNTHMRVKCERINKKSDRVMLWGKITRCIGISTSKKKNGQDKVYYY